MKGEIKMEEEKKTRRRKDENKEDNMTIEQGFEKLNELLRLMESEDTGLEDSFDLYQKGVELVKTLNGKLDKVEGKLTEVDCDNE